MTNSSTDKGRPAADQSGETKLRGEELEGSEQKRAADHVAYEKRRNPDTTVRVDGEEDSLYTDGLELEDETPPLGTDGRSADNAR
jgi:hypothetical protein